MANLGQKFHESFRTFTAINDILQEDSSLALRQFHDAVAKFNDNQSKENGEDAEFYAKASIRALLGHVDGVAYTLRRIVVQSADEAGLSIPPSKLAELRERKYDVETDSILDEEKRLSTEASIKLATTWFPKLFGSDFRLDTNGEGWRGFKRIIRVRNDFTHPKRLEHLFATAAFPAIQPTNVWFLVQMRNMFAECGSKLGNVRPSLEDAVLEYPYKEAKHPIVKVFSDQDVSDIQTVGARTFKYVELMLTKSSRDVARAINAIDTKLLPILSHSYQYAVRTAVRTLFSEVETRTGAATFFIEAAERRGEIQLSDADKLSLSEGEVEDKLVAALVIFSREYGNDFTPEQSGEPWKQFRGTRFFRDRLTHPKDLNSLKVDAVTTMALLNAAQYFMTTTEAFRLDPDKYVLKAKGLEDGIAEQTTAQEASQEDSND
jgi:hypothetical protein